MNERIKELAKQAGGYWNHGDFNMGSSIEFQESDLEKFAELIVNECASLFPGTFTDQQYQRRIDKTIRKHFGVDE